MSDKGRQQASALVDTLSLHPVKRVLSSPAVRCITTVEPLAARFGLPVEQDDRLAEGASLDDVESLLGEVSDAALCSHGDVIPMLLRELTNRGMRPAQGLRWSKASTWVIERGEDGWGTGTYVPAPTL